MPQETTFTRECKCTHIQAVHAHPKLGAGRLKPNECVLCDCKGFIFEKIADKVSAGSSSE